MSHSAPTPSPVSLFGIPLDLGAQNLGVDIGPGAFRYRNIKTKLESAGLAVTDQGDITCPRRDTLKAGDPHQRYAADIARIAAETAQRVQTDIAAGHRIVGLGGDHSVTLGLVSGAAAAVSGDLGLIYFDAHGDMNTPETTLTGNIHGMHLAALLGFGPDVLTQVHTPERKINPAHLLHVGGNDFDQAELDLIRREKLAAYTLTDVLATGLAPLFAKIDALAAGIGHIWVSLDLDVIDRLYAPGAGMPNPGGLSYREIAAIAAYIGAKTNVVGVDVVEYNPLQDIQNQTAELGIELIAKFLGVNYSWYSNYLHHNAL